MEDTKGQAGKADTWAIGDLYQPFIGRWSRLVAPAFLGWLGLPAGKRWLDVGCGTGALSRTILEWSSPVSVHGIDPSQGYVTFAREKIMDERITFSVGTIETLQLPGDSFDAVVSGLVLNFLPDPPRAIAEMKQLTRKGGTIAAYVWDYAEKMELLRYFWDAAAALDPAAVALDEGLRFPLCRPEPLKTLFTEAGLLSVDFRALDVSTRFESFDDFWAPFLGGQGPAPGYAMALSEARRALLRDRLRSELPISNDGSISLIARAWGIRGVKL
jgi:SAM-dependent methyltransferase